MARPTVWRRDGQAFVGGTSAVGHDAPSIAVFEGETVGRIRFQYQWSVFPEIPFEPWGVQGVLGVRLQNDLSTVPTVGLPGDISSEEWMWIEGVGWKQEAAYEHLTDASEVQVISAPADGGYRDVKAQRRCTADGRLWLQDSCMSAGATQGRHYLSFFMSALIILP